MKGKSFEITVLIISFIITVFAAVFCFAYLELEAVELFGILVFILLLYAVPFIVIYKTNIHTLVKNRPEQREQVEVIGKKLAKSSYTVSRHGRHTYSHVDALVVAFKFADGSIKEISVGRSLGYESIRDADTGKLIYSKVKKNKVYESFKNGDEGILTYKERDNIEEKFKKMKTRYKGRLFIGFEKE